MQKLTLLVLVLLVANTAGVTTDERTSSEVETEHLTSMSGVKYEFTYYQNRTITVDIYNQDNKTLPSGYTIDVDSQTFHLERITVNGSHHLHESFNITSSIDVTRDTHTIYVSTFGDDAYINFTEEMSSTQPGSVPTPQITDVTIANGTARGNESTVAYVTITNPSNQLYPMKVLVHTQRTDGGFHAAATPAYNKTTVKVELLEPMGSQVAGEARLYVNRPSSKKGALDQVEFVGRANASTRHWNESYRPITPPWEPNSYEYENASLRDDRGGIDELADRRPILAALGAIVALVVTGFAYRKTR